MKDSTKVSRPDSAWDCQHLGTLWKHPDFRDQCYVIVCDVCGKIVRYEHTLLVPLETRKAGWP